jgi:branched-chain amino acid transport system permease protein
MVKIEHKRALLVFRFGDKKFEWPIETRYWRNPLLGMAGLGLLPAILMGAGRFDLMSLIVTANIYACIAIPLGWQMTGIGRLNFGPQAFLGIGGYVAGLLSIHLGFSAFQTLPIVILAGIVFGIILSPLTSIAKGLYFSLITLILPLIFLEISYYFSIFKGETGLSGIAPLFSIANVNLEYLSSSYFSWILMVIFLFVVQKVLTSRVGVYAAAINDDEEVAANLGLNIKKSKQYCFVITSVMITITGWFAAHYFGTFAGVTYLKLPFMLKILLMVMIGGRGDIYGSVYGAYFIVILETTLTTFLGPINYVVFPFILIILLFTLPEGLYGIYRKHHYREYYPTVRIRKR